MPGVLRKENLCVRLPPRVIADPKSRVASYGADARGVARSSVLLEVEPAVESTSPQRPPSVNGRRGGEAGSGRVSACARANDSDSPDEARLG